MGLVASLLLHALLLIGVSYWLRVLTAKYKSELSQLIPIEYIEVPPEQAKQTKPPSQTKRRAAKDSVASGKVKPERLVSAAKSVPSVVSKFSASPKDSAAPKPAQSELPEHKQSAAVLPNPSPQKLQPEPQKTAVAPTIPQPQPQPQKPEVVPTTPKPQLQKTGVAPIPFLSLSGIRK